MRNLLLVVVVFLMACEESKNGFIEIKSSYHHHLALEAIKSAVPAAEYFEVHQWYGPDTLTSWPDTAIRMPVRYKLEFDYREKRGDILKKYGNIVFNVSTDTIMVVGIVDRS